MVRTFTKQVEGGVISGSSQEAVDELAAELERRAADEREREKLFPGDSREQMGALARLFPTLRSVVPDRWDTDRFLAWFVTNGGSGGACHAARFLLNVWNPSTDWREVLAKDEQREIEDDDTESKKVLIKALKKLRSDLRKDLENEEAEKAKDRKREPYPVAEERVTAELRKCFTIVGPFNAAAAVGTWDGPHRQAFMQWIAYPCWP